MSPATDRTAWPVVMPDGTKLVEGDYVVTYKPDLNPQARWCVQRYHGLQNGNTVFIQATSLRTLRSAVAIGNSLAKLATVDLHWYDESDRSSGNRFHRPHGMDRFRAWLYDTLGPKEPVL